MSIPTNTARYAKVIEVSKRVCREISSVREPRFQRALFALPDEEQAARIQQALAPLTCAVPQQPEMALPMAA